MGMEELFGEVIYSYSRAQAIEDGVLVNLNDPHLEEMLEPEHAH